jgi:hypothetical protein
VEALRQHPHAAAVYGDYRAVDVNYRTIRVEKKRQATFDEIFCFDAFISPCAAFVRMDALNDGSTRTAHLRSYFKVGDYGLWVFIGARYPMQYVAGLMADFMVHGGEISYELKHCQAYIRDCEETITRFQSETHTSRRLDALKNRALARLYLNYGNALAPQHPSEALGLAWRAIRRRPRLILTRTFFGVLLKSFRLSGLAAVLPRRA